LRPGLDLVVDRKPKQSVQRVDVPDSHRSIADRLKLFGRRQQQLFDDESGNLVEASPRLQRQRRELRLEPGQFRAADGLETLTQRDKRGDDLARLQLRG
jgi:hypothetical protein